MKQKNDKKTIIALLIILAISIIGGGIWTYNSLNDSEDVLEVGYVDAANNDLTIDEVFKIKREVLKNIGDFLETKNDSNNILDEVYLDDQFYRLGDIDVAIDIDDYSNNPNPFVTPVSDNNSGEDQ